MENFQACSQQEIFLTCDTMDEVCYSSNYDNDDCDERRLETVPAGNHCCEDHGIFVTTSWLFHWPTDRRSWLQQTGPWPEAFKMGEMNDLGFGSRQVMGETSIVSNITVVVVTDTVHATWRSLDSGRQICAVCNWIHGVTAIKDHNSSIWRTTDGALADRMQIQGSLTLDNLILRQNTTVFVSVLLGWRHVSATLGHPQVTKMYNEEKLYSVRSLVAVHILNFQRDLVVMRFIRTELLICSNRKVDSLITYTLCLCDLT